jgi:hypothetical protein
VEQNYRIWGEHIETVKGNMTAKRNKSKSRNKTVESRGQKHRNLRIKMTAKRNMPSVKKQIKS